MKRKSTIIFLVLVWIALLMAFGGYIYKIGDEVSIGRYSNDFNAAVTAIGASNLALVVDTTVTLDTTTTCPATMKLKIGRGGLITLGAYDLTINGPFEAPLSQVFNENSTGKVSFGDGAVKGGIPPQWYGASGDGSTDDSAYLVDWAALDYGHKIMPKGTGAYIISSALTVDDSDQLIEFEEGAELQIDTNAASASGTHFFTVSGDNVTIRNYKMNGNQANNTGSCKAMGMTLTGSHILLEKPYIYNVPAYGTSWGDGIYIQTDANNITINSPILIDNQRNGIAVVDGWNIYINDIYADGQGYAGVDAECDSGSTDTANIIVDGGYIGNGKYGFVGIGFENTKYISFTVKNLTIDTMSSYGIDVRSADDFIIDNCVIKDTTQVSIYLESTGSYPYLIRDGQITNNKIYNSSTAGISIAGHNTANRYARDITVANNIIDTTSASYEGITLSFGNHVAILNNSIKNTSGKGIAASSSIGTIIRGNRIRGSGGDGIEISGGSDAANNQIVGNNLKNGVGNGIDVNSAVETIIMGNMVDGYDYSVSIVGTDYNYLGDNSFFDPNTNWINGMDGDTVVAHHYVSDEIDLTALGASIYGPVFKGNILLITGNVAYTEAYPYDPNCTAATIKVGDADDDDKYVASTTLNVSKSIGNTTSLSFATRKFVAGDIVMFTHTQSDCATGSARVVLTYINTCN